jgi:hypothetical protein
MRLALGGIVSLAVLLAAPSAEAAQRYAAPNGTGEACTQAAPCVLKEAIAKAKANDEVIVGTGTYAVAEPLFAEGEGVYIHGDFTAPMPAIKAALSGPVINGTLNSRIAYLEVDNLSKSAGGVFCPQGSFAERLRVKVSGERSVALQAISGCVARDSLLLADGPLSIGLVGSAFEDGFTGVVRNVTAIASGTESVGILGEYGPALPGNYTIDVKNTIAEGAADLYASEGTNGFGNIVVANSNFDRPKLDFGAKLTDAGGNQATAPLFVNAAGGDYREAAGSPTIDAGVADPLVGATDLLGSPRIVGGAIDIGAYEFVPAVAGEIQSLTVAKGPFKAARSGAAIGTGVKRSKPRIGTTVTYALTAAATVEFSVERKLPGRKAGKKCVKQTKANRGKKKCPLYRSVKGSFTHSGVVGQNLFVFSGRVGGKALKPGRYRLTGKTGASSRAAAFRIAGK